MTPRAAPMRPEERRRAIVEAVVPLVLESGTMPTTREIARAADVAEGTIFRVFDDKAALLTAVAQHVLDPPEGDERFRALIAEHPDLDRALRAVVDRMRETSTRVMSVLMLLRQHRFGDAERHQPPTGPPEFLVRSNEVLLRRLTELFDRHRDELRTEPEAAAQIVRGLVFGTLHPGMTGERPLTTDQIVDAVLHGVARKDPRCC